MTEIQHINRNSDFSILVRFIINGVVAEVPSYPWRLVFTTDTTHSFNRYTADFDGENFHHCYRVSDSEVFVVVENHHLGPGSLQMALEVDVPSNVYQDGILSAEIPSSTQIELWDKASDTTIPAPHVEAIISNLIYWKGGLPKGGTIGQVLKKQSEDNYDTAWDEDLGAKAMTVKPGLIVPATGGNQKAEIFNNAMPSKEGALPGDASHAEGINTFAGGRGAHAEGEGSRASGYLSHAEGNYSTASGQYSHAEGDGSTASNLGTHAEGVGTKATWAGAHAEGAQTTAQAVNAHAEGRATNANGSNSHAEGEETAANGANSHAEGHYTVTSGANSHAEGDRTEAQALNSHAEGEGSVAKGKSSHAGGATSVVEAEAGLAHGINAVSKNRGEAVFGKNNEPDTTGKSVFQVGIGANRSKPKTGMQIDNDGTIWIINTASGNRISLQSWLNDIQLKKVVVDALPEAGDPSTIYILRVTTADEAKHNYFEEYIYLNGAWELLGTSDTDETLVERILNNPTFAAILADKATQEQVAEAQQTAVQAYERGDQAYSRGDQAYERGDQAYTRAEDAYTRADQAHAKATDANNRSRTNASNCASLRSDLTATNERLAREMQTRSDQDDSIRADYQGRDQEIYKKISDVQTSITNYIDETRDLLLPYTDTLDQLLAEGSNNLAQRVASLENMFNSLISGDIIAEKLVVRNLQVFGNTSLIKWGEGAPVVAPDFVGQRYIDTTNKLVYTAIGNAAVADWAQQ